MGRERTVWKEEGGTEGRKEGAKRMERRREYMCHYLKKKSYGEMLLAQYLYDSGFPKYMLSQILFW